MYVKPSVQLPLYPYPRYTTNDHCVTCSTYRQSLRIEAAVHLKLICVTNSSKFRQESSCYKCYYFIYNVCSLRMLFVLKISLLIPSLFVMLHTHNRKWRFHGVELQNSECVVRFEISYLSWSVFKCDLSVVS